MTRVSICSLPACLEVLGVQSPRAPRVLEGLCRGVDPQVGHAAVGPHQGVARRVPQGACVGCHRVLVALVHKGLVPCTLVLCSSPLIRLWGRGDLHLHARKRPKYLHNPASDASYAARQPRGASVELWGRSDLHLQGFQGPCHLQSSP